MRLSLFSSVSKLLQKALRVNCHLEILMEMAIKISLSDPHPATVPL